MDGFSVKTWGGVEVRDQECVFLCPLLEQRLSSHPMLCRKLSPAAAEEPALDLKHFLKSAALPAVLKQGGNLRWCGLKKYIYPELTLPSAPCLPQPPLSAPPFDHSPSHFLPSSVS